VIVVKREELNLKQEYDEKNCNVALEDEGICIEGNLELQKPKQKSPEITFEAIHFNSVVIKPHVTRTGGKQRLYGRIQVTVDKSFIGDIVDITVLVKRVKRTKNV
jgi:hypothetical protein